MTDSATSRRPLRDRPLSPHLSVYRLVPTMVMSILHRITGATLYFGTLLVAWWLLAAASGAEAFETANWFFGSIVGRIILFGYSWTLIHHMLGGIKHLVQDTGNGLGRETTAFVARVQTLVSVSLTVLLWIVGYAVRLS